VQKSTEKPTNDFRREASLRFLDGQGFLFDPAVQKLYLANRTAAFIWCCFDEEMQPDDIAHRLQETFGLTPAIAKSYVKDAVQEWTRLGLLDNTNQKNIRTPEESWLEPIRSGPDGFRHEDMRQPFAERTCRLLDTHFIVRFGSEATCRALDPYLLPLATDEKPNTTLAIDVVENGELRALLHQGRIIEQWGTLEEIVPILKLGLIQLAIKKSLDFGALHAAAVCQNDDGPCVLFPGPSGAGKSTLTAALLSEGFESLGDDTVVLARDTLNVRGVPFGICLKNGAWELLATRFPHLTEQPIHNRLDGKRVRYLIPDTRRGGVLEKARPAAWIVFPQQVGDRHSELVPLSRADALSRLTDQFCPLDRGLNLQKIDRLIEWMGGIDCYELRCGTLESGVDLIKALWK
jgi:hypothetical protein